jgi:putative ABC transport system permease protein
MISVAWRMLAGDKIKFGALIIGLSFAAMMIAQQASIFTGYATRAGAWVRDTSQGDLWVMDDQVEVTIDEKRVTDTQLQRVRGVEGVAWAVPMFVGTLPARLPDGTIQAVRLIGLDDATLTGGPPEMVQGRLADLRTDRGVIVNGADLAKLLRPRTPGAPALGVGDRLDINDHEVQIVGTFAKTPEFFWEPAVYTTYSRALRMAPKTRKMTQYVLVKVQPGADVAEVGERITRATGLAARTGPEFVRLSTWYVLIQTGILINFGITIALGFVIGALVSGLLLYTFVLENSRAFAALRAMGASTRQLAGMVMAQAGAAGFIGYGLGVGVAAVTGLVVGTSGGLAYRMVWQVPVFVAGAVLVCCVLAGLVSLRRVLSLEPAVVFK